MPDINELLRDECQRIWRFGEILSDILAEDKLSQSDFAKRLNYSESVVSRLINAQRIPRWVDYREIRRITGQVECTDAQVGMLISAFICDVLREKGLDDDK